MMSGNNCGRLVPPDHVVVDIDPRNFTPNVDYGRFTNLNHTPTVLTGGGGMQLTFTIPKNIHTVTKFPGCGGIDILGQRHNTVAPGSIHPSGKDYLWLPKTVNLPITPLPEWILKEIVRPEYCQGQAGVQIPLNIAEEYLMQLDPLQFGNNDDWLRLMFAFHDATGGGDEALKVFTAWSERDPKYAADHYRKGNIGRWKSSSANKPGNITVWTFIKILDDCIIGTTEIEKVAADASAVMDFADVIEMPEVGPIEKTTLQKLTERFYVVNDNDGKVRIYEKVMDEGMTRYRWKAYGLQDFLNTCKYIEKFGLIPDPSGKRNKDGQVVFVPVYKYWLEAPGNRTFNGMVMLPECKNEKTPQGALNMWTGFRYTPRQGSWDTVKTLILDSLCSGDQVSYDYVIKWMARAVQKPWEPAGTALVFRGGKGAGKSTLGTIFYKLFGHHGMPVSNAKHLVSNFNAHLRDCVALFADEAFWAGDKDGESSLKSLITESIITYEAKGKDLYAGRNYLHIIMVSNSDWVVPASMDERRFAVCDVEIVHDSKWFDQLYHEMNNCGGMEAMLYELIHMDISDFNIRDVPQNEALSAQKIHGMNPLAAWLLEAAENGWQFGEFTTVAEEDDFIDEQDGGEYVVKEVYASYLRYCNERNVRQQRQNEKSFGWSLKKYMPKDSYRRERNKKKIYCYHFPSAEKTVDHIRKMFGIGKND